MKRLGPDLKDLKLSMLKLPGRKRQDGEGKGTGPSVPAPLADLYYDLRDRRLLPLVALILVAIAAVPILLSSDSELPAPDTARLAPVQAPGSDLRVVEATPGLRDYRKRLRARSATNPFKQRYTAPILSGAELQSESGSGGSGSDSSQSSTGGSEGSSSSPSSGGSSGGGSGGGSVGGGGGGGGGGGRSAEPGKPRIYTFTSNIQISHAEAQADGSSKMGEPEVRKDVRAPKPLPSEKKPVLTFLGVKANSATSLKALMLVSDEVTGVFGEAECVSGAEKCELLAVAPGSPVVLEYGEHAVRYRFTVTRIDMVEVGRAQGPSSPQRFSK